MSTDDMQLKAARRDARKYKKALRELTDVVTVFIHKFDARMKDETDEAHGKAMAGLANALDYANDCARHFGLGDRLAGDDLGHIRDYKAACKRLGGTP